MPAPVLQPVLQPLLHPALVDPAGCTASAGGACGWLARQLGSDTAARAVAYVLGTPLFLAAVVVVALLARWLAHRAIRRGVERFIARPPRLGRLDPFRSDGGGGLHTQVGEPRDGALAVERRAQRARAIGSLLTATTTVVVWVVAVLVALPEVGVEIAGLLAGAGVVGVALAFGAQTLVGDVLAGIFMLAEDQYGVGDVVDMGEASGAVEAVGLRVTRLRALDGTVWHVRNGEVKRVGNMSQGWSRVVLDLEVDEGEDVGRVMELLRGVGRDLHADPALAPQLLEEPEVWGIEAFGPDTLVIRMIAKTVPLQQWAVARELRRRVKEAFDTAGVELASRREIWVRGADAALDPSGPGDRAGQ